MVSCLGGIDLQHAHKQLMGLGSQYLNKVKCIKELRNRIKQHNYIPPIRIKTKPTKGSIERRLLNKKHKSEKKKNRNKPNLDNY